MLTALLVNLLIFLPFLYRRVISPKFRQCGNPDLFIEILKLLPKYFQCLSLFEFFDYFIRYISALGSLIFIQSQNFILVLSSVTSKL